MNYRFLNELLLRVPLYSYEYYSADKITAVLHDPFFQAGLYLASPQLYSAIAEKAFVYQALSVREKLSVMRYYNRMSFRPTPFGSFSSFTFASWGKTGPIVIAEKTAAQLHLNLDWQVILHFARDLTQGSKLNNSYTCNSALYRSGKDFRFIKTSYSFNKERIFFDLESIESNQLTNALFLFCRGSYRKGTDIMKYMIEITDCDPYTASGYLSFLVEANILVPFTSPNLIGQDYLNRLLYNAEIQASSVRDSLRAITEAVALIGFPDNQNLRKTAMAIQDQLTDSGKAPVKQVFYSGMEQRVVSGNLPSGYQTTIMDGLSGLDALSLPSQPTLLQQFIHDFRARYDKQKVPLLQAVDPESGIGYGSGTTVAGDTDLMRHVNFSQAQGNKVTLEWTATHSILLKRWNEKPSNNHPLELTAEDIAAIKVDNNLSCPPTIPVLFRIVGSQVYIESAGGASATGIIGRFTLWSKDVHGLGRQLAIHEQEANPKVLFADIGQLSDSHADNINRRQHIFDYEITVNTASALPPECQIALSDLWVSVVGNELILESKKLKKIIVPRLSSAYNYNHNNLGIFKLLCDLQYQGLRCNYSFSMEHYFPGMAHYPRVAYKNAILAPAVWHLSKEMLNSFKNLTPQEALSHLSKLRKKLNLPPVIALSKSDQQLVFNLDKEGEITVLLDCLKTAGEAVLQEFFLPDDQVVLSEGNSLINQFVAFLVQDSAVYKADLTEELPVRKNIAQSYILGSKWLYLKLYCAPEIANDILVRKLLPVLKQLEHPEIFSWFFVRYRDSGYHIRLRLKIRDDLVGQVLNLMKVKLSESIRFHLIREYQADTYQREMERYGPDIIGLVEEFFYGSSELVLNYLKVAERRSFRYTYHSLAFVSVRFLIVSFIADEKERLLFLERMVTLFYTEFATDKSLKIELDQKFRELKAEIHSLFGKGNYYNSLKLTRQAELYAIKASALVRATALFSPKRKNQLLADLIHMHLNRLFVDRQRNQELIVYYCLYKYHIAARAISRK